jgi:hypothetical protein
MKSIVTILLLCLTFGTVSAQQAQKKANALVHETQKEGNRAGRITVVWWVPPEFWRAALTANGTLPKDKIEEMVSSIQDVNVFAVIDGKVGSSGTADFVSAQELQKALQVRDTQNKPVALVPEEKQNDSARSMISMMQPLFASIMGEFGKNLTLFVFEGKNADGSRKMDPLKRGFFTVKLNEEEFRWRLPLGSLLPEGKCPKCKETFQGDYVFCPFDGKPLQAVQQ